MLSPIDPTDITRTRTKARGWASFCIPRDSALRAAAYSLYFRILNMTHSRNVRSACPSCGLFWAARST